MRLHSFVGRRAGAEHAPTSRVSKGRLASLRRVASCALWLCGIASCSPSAPVSVAGPPPTSPPSPGVLPVVSAQEATPRSAPDVVPTAKPAAVDPFAGASFPPPAFEPMHTRTAQEGDGQWSPVAHGLVEGEPVIYRAEVHPDRFKKHVFVTLVAFDRAHVALGLEAGTEEPESKQVAAAERSGLVPAAVQSGLLAVFNGGFKAKHGSYGMMLRGQEYVAPKDDACAVALYADGALRVRSWPVLAADAPKMVAWRQAPPCLVEQGAVNPKLIAEPTTRKWGAAQGGDREIRRSALALDASGRTLIYAFGDWITANQLADALAHVGVFDATELDINWSYTRFYFVEHGAGGPQLASSIIPKAKFNKNNYLTKLSFRDFFYVVLRGSSR